MARYGFNVGLDGHRTGPLSEEEAEQVAEGLAVIYYEAREKMLEAVARRAARGVDRPGWTERKAAEVTSAHAQFERLLQRAAKERESVLGGVIERAQLTGSEKFYDDMRRMLGNADVEHMSPNALKAGYILADLNNSLNAAERRILRQFDDKYADVIGGTSSLLATGSVTSREAVGMALTRFADEGIDGFTDRGGHHWSLWNYAEMATLTAINRATISGYSDTMRSYGYDLAIIDSHAGACPLCEQWEDVIVSVSGDNSEYPSLDDAESAGCFHPRCMHGITTYYEGISQPNRGTEFRTEPAPKQEESYAYSTRSKQRYYERQVRKYRDRAAVAQTPQQRTEALNRIRQFTGKLDALIGSQPANNYLYRHYDREHSHK